MAFNLLIVDDSRVMRAIIEKTLRMSDLPLGQVHHAENGQVALDLLADQWVDMIFADINMPVMNGIEMIEKLAENGVSKSIPIVVVSTEGSATRIEHLKQNGVVAFLRKPFQAEDFSAVVRDVLGITHA